MMVSGKRTVTPEMEVRLLREGIPESFHRVQAAICDRKSRTLLMAGNPEQVAFVRSALKPFQAVILSTTGTLEHYGLTHRDVAIACGSHKGTIPQARQAFNILWRCDIEPSTLQCPVPQGCDSPLQHNCSGKHAAMLAVCHHCNWESTNYLDRHHPVQRAIATRLSDLLGMPVDELMVAKDDCGAPTYAMSLRQMATLYAHLGSSDDLDLEQSARAMIAHPDLVSGPGGFDTDLMKLSQGAVVSKSGAEGIQCVARMGQGMGLALKVADGARRAKYAATLAILRQLGWISPDVAETLGETYLSLAPWKRLDVLGEAIAP